jgi:hypothetical protein
MRYSENLKIGSFMAIYGYFYGYISARLDIVFWQSRSIDKATLAFDDLTLEWFAQKIQNINQYEPH